MALNKGHRNIIERLLKAGASKSEIARALGVHRSTVTRELQRNSNPGGGYDAQVAQRLARVRKILAVPGTKNPIPLRHLRGKTLKQQLYHRPTPYHHWFTYYRVIEWPSYFLKSYLRVRSEFPDAHCGLFNRKVTRGKYFKPLTLLTYYRPLFEWYWAFLDKVAANMQFDRLMSDILAGKMLTAVHSLDTKRTSLALAG
ncbi:helix-turn-helix domain-containing protein [Persicobacter diffluens]|uniref:Transposase IS30-like HTH domain-containing protein n=1 Tax=Persicobacter diffluens TaxID=981 RepID=A0AAN4W2I7_9BACT|nr:hypothetical protein PEDI_44740 [Persicobacter diffluens]